MFYYCDAFSVLFCLADFLLLTLYDPELAISKRFWGASPGAYRSYSDRAPFHRNTGWDVPRSRVCLSFFTGDWCPAIAFWTYMDYSSRAPPSFYIIILFKTIIVFYARYSSYSLKVRMKIMIKRKTWPLIQYSSLRKLGNPVRSNLLTMHSIAA